MPRAGYVTIDGARLIAVLDGHIVWLQDEEPNMSDDLNPEFIFRTVHTELLVKAANGEIDLDALLRAELRNRGVDRSDRWIGHEAAERLWSRKTYVVQTENGPRRVSVPTDEPDSE